MDKPEKEVVEALLTAYPHLDYLMAETLLMMSAKGTLEKHLNVPSKEISTHTIVGAITVENNIKVEETLAWSEAMSPN